MNLYRTGPDIVRIQLNDYLTLCYYKDGLVFSVETWNDKFLPSTKEFWDV